MIRYLVKLAVRLVILVAAFFALGFLTAHVAGADDRGTYHCNPLTYGRPHSCHVAPVEFRSLRRAPLGLYGLRRAPLGFYGAWR